MKLHTFSADSLLRNVAHVLSLLRRGVATLRPAQLWLHLSSETMWFLLVLPLIFRRMFAAAIIAMAILRSVILNWFSGDICLQFYLVDCLIGLFRFV